MIEELYSQIINDLKNSKRPMIDLTNEEVDRLVEYFQKCTEKLIRSNGTNFEELKKNLCVINHLNRPIQQFQSTITLALQINQLSDEIKIFLIQSIEKHIIDLKTVTGNRLTYDFLEAFKHFSLHSSKDVLFWVINIIQLSGSQDIYFKEIINTQKWSIWDMFSKQNRQSIQLTKKLNEKWANLSIPPQ